MFLTLKSPKKAVTASVVLVVAVSLYTLTRALKLRRSYVVPTHANTHTHTHKHTHTHTQHTHTHTHAHAHAYAHANTHAFTS